jgi:hypothetical protein
MTAVHVSPGWRHIKLAAFAAICMLSITACPIGTGAESRRPVVADNYSKLSERAVESGSVQRSVLIKRVIAQERRSALGRWTMMPDHVFGDLDTQLQ